MLKTEILKILREHGEYVSGQQLCDTLGVSRTAVWKVIQKLLADGYEIEAVRNKGYRIIEAPDVASGEEIASLLHTEWAGRKIIYMEETDSTNIQAKKFGELGEPHGTVVIAEQQTAGRGRRGKSWVSPAGENIYMSILLRPEFSPAQAPMLTLLMAYSITEAVRTKAECNAKIKWPNDIVLHKRKICGILTEMSTEIDYINYVVIGAGINVNMSCMPEEISGMAGTLSQDGSTVRRAELAAAVLERFEHYYEEFLKEGNLAFIVDAYNNLLVNQDQEVKVHGSQESFEGKAVGINETGELLVLREDGRMEVVFAGEVSVRGMYGYI